MVELGPTILEKNQRVIIFGIWVGYKKSYGWALAFLYDSKMNSAASNCCPEC